MDIAENAKKLGFIHSVNFGNFTRFFKILPYNINSWSTFRICAKLGGIMATPYDTVQAKVDLKSSLIKFKLI